MQIPIPLFFASGKSGRSQADTDDGRLTLKRNVSEVDSIRTEGDVSAELNGDDPAKLVVHHKSGDRYEGTLTNADGVTALPEAVACQAYETVRHLAGNRLKPDDIEMALDLLEGPLSVPITSQTCLKRQ